MTRNLLILAGLLNLAVSILVVGGSWFLTYNNLKNTAHQVALIKGDGLFLMLDASRHWNARHGGVYAPVTPETQPNPYLNVPDRDITDENGRLLTKINPSYMVRQFSELLDRDKIEVRLASVEPIHFYNLADDWEHNGISKFLKGHRKSIVEKKEEVYRYITPMLVKKSCLSCHQNQGFQEGDVAGGISIKFPAEEIEKLVSNLKAKTSNNYWFVFFSVFLFGLIMFAIVVTIYNQLNRAKENEKELSYRANHDGLTGALNHSSLMEIAEHEYKRSCRQENNLAVLMLDLDYFKKVNDTYGHQIGDKILIAVIDQININIRDIDFVGRYGGEEFLILLPDVSEADALIIAERIRKTLKDIQIGIVEEKRSHDFSVGVSIGLAERKKLASESLEGLIKMADIALYKAKSLGRNRVVIAE